MKIGLISHQFPGTRGGGIGSYVLEAAAALARGGHEVHLFTLSLPADVRGVAAMEGVTLHEVAGLAERVEGDGGEGKLPAALAGAVESGGEGIYRLALGWILCEAVRQFQQEGGGLEVVEAPEYEALGLPLMLRPEGNLAVVTQTHLCSAIARAGNEGWKPEAGSRKSDGKMDDGLIDS